LINQQHLCQGDVNGDGLSDLIVGAFGASIAGIKTYEGKSYVVFGKNNTNAVHLSSIAAGTGGFVINVPTIKSSKPSPLTSPAEETAEPL
jgi:hypothetical protein